MNKKYEPWVYVLIPLSCVACVVAVVLLAPHPPQNSTPKPIPQLRSVQPPIEDPIVTAVQVQLQDMIAFGNRLDVAEAAIKDAQQVLSKVEAIEKSIKDLQDVPTSFSKCTEDLQHAVAALKADLTNSKVKLSKDIENNTKSVEQALKQALGDAIAKEAAARDTDVAGLRKVIGVNSNRLTALNWKMGEVDIALEIVHRESAALRESIVQILATLDKMDEDSKLLHYNRDVVLQIERDKLENPVHESD